jgi:hypothetical protein
MFDASINDEYNPGVPCIAPDESYMLFSSNIETKVNLAEDLYITFRRPNGGWSYPQKLGPTINTSQRESIPRISAKAEYLFFDRRGYGFYWADINVLDQFRTAYHPSPAVQGVNVNTDVNLAWEIGHGFRMGRAFDLGSHDIYFGTSFAEVNDANRTTHPNVDYNNTDVNSYNPGLLTWDTVYYWRIDEVNDFWGDPPVAHPNDPCIWKGAAWNFRTLGGKSFNPYPRHDTNDAYDVNNKLYMRWSKGLAAAGTNAHRVFFGTDYNSVRDANTSTPIIYRGVRTDANYPLSVLSPDYTLVPDANYYWRVDEINDANGLSPWVGDVWRHVFPSNYIIENFKEYVSSDDLNTVWKQNNLSGSCTWLGSPGGFIGGGSTLSLDTAGGPAGPGLNPGDSAAPCMILDYNNSGQLKDRYSEARFSYPAVGDDWTVSSLSGTPTPKLLHIAYLGAGGNAADPCLDRMYVMIRDTTGIAGQGPTIYNPNPTAQQQSSWRDWYIPLSDLSSPNVDLTKIRFLFIGQGLRCNKLGTAGIAGGGSGTVRFDNIWVTQPICNAMYGPTADFSDDCFVGIADLDLFSTDWLLTDTTLSYPDAVAPSVGPVLWFDFNETDGNISHNTGSSGSTYDANVINRNAATWDANGYIGRCINLVYGKNSCVNVPPAALAPFAPGGTKTALTFTLWINFDVNNPMDNWNGLIDAYGGTSEAIEIEIPTYQTPPAARARIASSDLSASNRRTGDFGGRWNHYAIVKDADANIMRIYENGARIAEVNNANIDTPLLDVVPTLFRIGSRSGDNWGMWAGKIDDFRMYDYALDANQIAWVATNGTKSIFVPLAEPTNLKRGSSPEVVNFGDFAVLANQWLTEKLWP